MSIYYLLFVTLAGYQIWNINTPNTLTGNKNIDVIYEVMLELKLLLYMCRVNKTDSGQLRHIFVFGYRPCLVTGCA